MEFSQIPFQRNEPFSIGFCLCKTFGKVRYQTAVCYRKDRLCDAEAYRGDCQSGGQQELRARDRFAAVGDRRQGRAGRPFRQFVFGDVPPYAAFSGVVHRDRRNSHSDPVLLDLYDILSETGVRTTQEHVARDEELIAFLQRVLDSLPDAQRRSRLVKVGEFKITLANLMLDKLLTIKKARIDIHPEEFSVRQLLDNVMMQYELMLEPTGKIKLEYETTQELITADKLCFLNAIVNLVDNAIKYSSGAPDIFVRCFTAGDYLCVSVTDHGVGIPKKYLKRIFRREFRIPKGKTVRCTGFGIGLSYIKMIAKAHKGKITVSSIYKKGSTFTLSIPKNR